MDNKIVAELISGSLNLESTALEKVTFYCLYCYICSNFIYVHTNTIDIYIHIYLIITDKRWVSLGNIFGHFIHHYQKISSDWDNAIRLNLCFHQLELVTTFTGLSDLIIVVYFVCLVTKISYLYINNKPPSKSLIFLFRQNVILLFTCFYKFSCIQFQPFTMRNIIEFLFCQIAAIFAKFSTSYNWINGKIKFQVIS